MKKEQNIKKQAKKKQEQDEDQDQDQNRQCVRMYLNNDNSQSEKDESFQNSPKKQPKKNKSTVPSWCWNLYSRKKYKQKKKDPNQTSKKRIFKRRRKLQKLEMMQKKLGSNNTIQNRLRKKRQDRSPLYVFKRKKNMMEVDKKRGRPSKKKQSIDIGRQIEKQVQKQHRQYLQRRKYQKLMNQQISKHYNQLYEQNIDQNQQNNPLERNLGTRTARSHLNPQQHADDPIRHSLEDAHRVQALQRRMQQLTFKLRRYELKNRQLQKQNSNLKQNIESKDLQIKLLEKKLLAESQEAGYGYERVRNSNSYNNMGDYMAHNLYMDRNYLPMANTRNLNTNPNGRNINELRYEPSQDNMSSEDISRVLDRNMNRMFEISRMGQKSMNVQANMGNLDENVSNMGNISNMGNMSMMGINKKQASTQISNNNQVMTRQNMYPSTDPDSNHHNSKTQLNHNTLHGQRTQRPTLSNQYHSMWDGHMNGYQRLGEGRVIPDDRYNQYNTNFRNSNTNMNMNNGNYNNFRKSHNNSNRNTHQINHDANMMNWHNSNHGQIVRQQYEQIQGTPSVQRTSTINQYKSNNSQSHSQSDYKQ